MANRFVFQGRTYSLAYTQGPQVCLSTKYIAIVSAGPSGYDKKGGQDMTRGKSYHAFGHDVFLNCTT